MGVKCIGCKEVLKTNKNMRDGLILKCYSCNRITPYQSSQDWYKIEVLTNDN